jgi:hypothetical protein
LTRKTSRISTAWKARPLPPANSLAEPDGQQGQVAQAVVAVVAEDAARAPDRDELAQL